jgi:hypothetical protein
VTDIPEHVIERQRGAMLRDGLGRTCDHDAAAAVREQCRGSTGHPRRDVGRQRWRKRSYAAGPNRRRHVGRQRYGDTVEHLR